MLLQTLLPIMRGNRVFLLRTQAKRITPLMVGIRIPTLGQARDRIQLFRQTGPEIKLYMQSLQPIHIRLLITT